MAGVSGTWCPTMTDTRVCHWCEQVRSDEEFEGDCWWEDFETPTEVCSVCVHEDMMRQLRDREGQFYWMTDAQWRAAKRKAGIA